MIRKYSIVATLSAMEFLTHEDVNINLREIYRMALHEELARPLRNIIDIELRDNIIFVSRARTIKSNHEYFPIGVAEVMKGGKIAFRYTDG